MTKTGEKSEANNDYSHYCISQRDMQCPLFLAVRREVMNLIMNRKLAAKMKESPYTYAEIAKRAGITRDTIIRRLDRGNWRRAEIENIGRLLRLTKAELLELFFPDYEPAEA